MFTVRLEEENQRLRSDLLAAGVEVEEDQLKEAGSMTQEMTPSK